MQIMSSKMQYLPTAVLVVVIGVFLYLLSTGDVATAEMYTESAHGDPVSGVNRSGTECPTGTPCPQGDCAHCHETFDNSICGEYWLPHTILYRHMDPV